jgi:aminoglycoside phosphotransferase (APT) family kinase protein
MHDDEFRVDSRAVVDLITAQFPQWAELPILEVSTAGTMNAIFRIGDSLAARFPLRQRDRDDVRAELERDAAAAKAFHDASPFPSPLTVAFGEPGPGVPMPWSIQSWLPGHDALTEDPENSQEFAEDLATLIRALRSTDTGGRQFSGAGRGGDLPDHDEWMGLCFSKSESLVDVDPLREMWSEFRLLPRSGADVMCHADLTPANVLVYDGRLTGVLDTGGFAPADPALDLVAVWHLLGDKGRDYLRAELGCEDTQWRRGMAWALQQAIGLVWYYADSNPAMAKCGHRTLGRLARSHMQ